MQRTPKRGCRRPKETPKEKEGDEEVGKAAVMMNGEGGAQRKFWRNGEENPRQGEDRGMIGGGAGRQPSKSAKGPLGYPILFPEGGVGETLPSGRE